MLKPKPPGKILNKGPQKVENPWIEKVPLGENSKRKMIFSFFTLILENMKVIKYN